jgi:hypothetical protein
MQSKLDEKRRMDKRRGCRSKWQASSSIKEENNHTNITVSVAKTLGNWLR